MLQNLKSLEILNSINLEIEKLMNKGIYIYDTNSEEEAVIGVYYNTENDNFYFQTDFIGNINKKSIGVEYFSILNAKLAELNKRGHVVLFEEDEDYYLDRVRFNILTQRLDFDCKSVMFDLNRKVV